MGKKQANLNKKNIRKILKKTWYFIWEDNSVWSWIVNIILAFVLIKFIVYPGLGFLLSTSHPVVAVVSSSMEHDRKFDDWWEKNKDWYLQNEINEEEFESLLKDGKYEEAAQLLADNLGIAFNEELEIAYGVSRLIDGAVQYLPYVFDTPIVTTNFDDVLKRSYENAGLPFEEVVAGHLAEELPRYLGAGRRVLIKLHGTALTGRGRVLTLEEYENHYQHAELLRNLIESLCNRTLLFIGCSLNTDRTLSVMSDISLAKGHDNTSRHYAFLSCSETEEERISKKQQLANSNIYPIWYPPGEHDESIEALLVKLTEEVK